MCQLLCTVCTKSRRRIESPSNWHAAPGTRHPCYHFRLVPFLYALICLIWGSTWLGIKVGLVGVPPFLGAGLRFLLATLLVGIVLAARRRRIVLTRDDKVCIL